jgi:lysophospholipase L1-like esterase
MSRLRACTFALTLTSLALAAGPARAEPIDYVAVGASDAVGVGAHPLTEGYVFLIRRELDRRLGAGKLENLGISGARVDEINGAVARYLRSRPAPDVVTVWSGANDLVGGDDADRFEATFGALLAQLARGTRARVVVANLPRLTRLPVFRGQPIPTVTDARIDAFNAAIARQARAHGASLVDLSGVEVSADLVERFDGFHPSNEGHKALANRFLAVIRPRSP